MNSLPENYTPYEKLLAALARNGVDLVVVGGMAITLNSFVLFSRKGLGGRKISLMWR